MSYTILISTSNLESASALVGFHIMHALNAPMIGISFDQLGEQGAER
jgi:hypothetical protein